MAIRRRSARGSRRSASSSASSDGQRAAGSAWSPRSRAARTQSGGLRAGSQSRPSVIAAASSASVSPSNGRVPWTASHSATQYENWSARASQGSPRSCSGAMYLTVPATLPDAVTVVPSAAIAASPKSPTRARPSRSTRTFSGLKSRCTIPSRCAATRPCPAPRNIASTSRHDRSVASQPRRVGPGTYSITRNVVPSSDTISCTGITFGCDSRAIACASATSWARPRMVGPNRRSPCSSLMATLRSSAGS